MQKRIICILLSLLLCVVTGCSAGNTDIANKLTEELTETAEKITSPAPNSSMIPSFGTVAPHYPTPTPSASVSAPAEETPQTAYAQVYSEMPDVLKDSTEVRHCKGKKKREISNEVSRFFCFIISHIRLAFLLSVQWKHNDEGGIINARKEIFYSS